MHSPELRYHGPRIDAECILNNARMAALQTNVNVVTSSETVDELDTYHKRRV